MSFGKIVYPSSKTTPQYPSDATIKKHLKDHWVIQPGSHAEVIQKGHNLKTARQSYSDPNSGDMNNGRVHFNGGFLWNDASPENQNNQNFKLGYCQALEISLEAYYIGFKAYIDNKSIDDLSKIYRNNMHCAQGYDDANDLCSRCGVTFSDDTSMKMYAYGMKFANIGEDLVFIPSSCYVKDSDVIHREFSRGYNDGLNRSARRNMR